MSHRSSRRVVKAKTQTELDPDQILILIITAPTICIVYFATMHTIQRLVPLHKKPKSKNPHQSQSQIRILQPKAKISTIKESNIKNIIYKLTNQGIKIYADSITQHNVVKQLLHSLNFEYFTHTTEEEKKVKFCLYGLWRMDCNTVKKEIIQNKLNAIDVKILESKKVIYKNKTRPYEQCTYAIFFHKKDKIKLSDLDKVNFLFETSIIWEVFTNPTYVPTQCSRCQEFGHGTQHCNRSYRCVRFSGNPKSQDCEHLPIDEEKDENGQPKSVIKIIPKDKLKCINCGENHTSSYRGCRVRKTYINIRQNTHKNFRANREPPEYRLNYHDFPPLSASSRSKTTSFTPAPPPQQNYWSSIPPVQQTASSSDLFNAGECQQIMQEFISKLSQCKSKADQISKIGEITFKFLYGSR